MMRSHELEYIEEDLNDKIYKIYNCECHECVVRRFSRA